MRSTRPAASDGSEGSGRSRTGYDARIDHVMRHVRDHLDDEHSLDSLSRISGFSPFHFHRVFTSLVGETPRSFVERVRLERAAALLRSGPRPLIDVAFNVGFASLSEFSRAFKRRFGCAPSRWREWLTIPDSKICQTIADDDSYLRAAGLDEVRIEELVPLDLVVVSVRQPYLEGRLAEGYQRLAGMLTAMHGTPGGFRLIGMSWDDPDATPHQVMTYDLCAVIDDETIVGREVIQRKLPRFRAAMLRATGGLDAVARAWDHLYREWLPSSSMQPADLPAMEMYRRGPEELGWSSFDIDCCIPIEPFIR